MCVRDKAGGYGIQALGGMLVEYVHGDFLNVVGFPLNHFCKQLDMIYNRLELESGSVLNNGTHLILTEPSPNLPASSKNSSSSSPRPKSPSAIQTNGTQSSPSDSPIHKVCTSHSKSTILVY